MKQASDSVLGVFTSDMWLWFDDLTIRRGAQMKTRALSANSHNRLMNGCRMVERMAGRSQSQDKWDRICRHATHVRPSQTIHCGFHVECDTLAGECCAVARDGCGGQRSETTIQELSTVWYCFMLKILINNSFVQRGWLICEFHLYWKLLNGKMHFFRFSSSYWGNWCVYYGLRKVI